MALWELSAVSWETLAGIDTRRAVAILPTGALEAHGPHLPLATDVIIAEAMARSAAERLAGTGREAILLPALPFTPAPFADGFPGTISISADTLECIVVDIGRALAAHGIRVLAIANAHLDPAHLKAVAAAGATLEHEGVAFAAPDITRRHLAERLTPEFQTGACHAGCFETSIVLAVLPELVDDAIRRELEPVPLSLSVAIGEGRRTFQEAGGARAYFGDPASATAAEGAASIDELGRILAEAVVGLTDPREGR
jgi:creatinine amidohydrolase